MTSHRKLGGNSGSLMHNHNIIIYQIRLPKKQDVEAFVKAHGIRTCLTLRSRHTAAVLPMENPGRTIAYGDVETL